eukprot:5714553-Prorocentrum_lima.AAC.1
MSYDGVPDLAALIHRISLTPRLTPVHLQQLIRLGILRLSRAIVVVCLGVVYVLATDGSLTTASVCVLEDVD